MYTFSRRSLRFYYCYGKSWIFLSAKNTVKRHYSIYCIHLLTGIFWLLDLYKISIIKRFKLLHQNLEINLCEKLMIYHFKISLILLLNSMSKSLIYIQKDCIGPDIFNFSLKMILLQSNNMLVYEYIG